MKAYSGQIRNVGDRWEKRDRWGWRRLTTHPGVQARRNAERLKEYLKGQSVGVGWVQSVVVWAGEQGVLMVGDPTIPLWILEELPDHIEELWQNRSLSEETVQKLVDVLKRTIKVAKETR